MIKNSEKKKNYFIAVLCFLNHDTNTLSSCYSPDSAHGLQTGPSSVVAYAHAVLLVDLTPVITLEEIFVNDLYFFFWYKRTITNHRCDRFLTLRFGI